MKIIFTTPVVPAVSVRVIANSKNPRNVSWMRIVDAKTGKVLHTGCPAYIKKIARERYLRSVNLV